MSSSYDSLSQSASSSSTSSIDDDDDDEEQGDGIYRRVMMSRFGIFVVSFSDSFLSFQK